MSFFALNAFVSVNGLSNLYVFHYVHTEQTGAWGCFDAFNRIHIEVFSVVAQQIRSILSALSARQCEFHFEGQLIPLVDSCGIFVTMNTGKLLQMCNAQTTFLFCHMLVDIQTLNHTEHLT